MSVKWRTLVESALTKAWEQQRSVLSIALRPISAFYLALTTIWRWMFRIGLRGSARLPVRVIVVGNVVAGGAGKTPTVLAIAEHLHRQGFHVGLVSRGYGRKSKGVQEVFSHSTAGTVGDEPLLLKKKLKLPVFVGSNRVLAGQHLLQKYPQVNILVCDDGIQHLQLYRDAEVYVFDDRGVGNGLPLPSGPLRSPWPPTYIAQSGQSANRSVVLHTGTHPAFKGHVAHRHLSPWGIQSNGVSIALKDLQSTNKTLVAIAGIAHPHRFFDMLAAIGIQPTQNIALPDHYDFADWVPPSATECTILCTEKDAVKVWTCAPMAIAIPLIQTMDEQFFTDIRLALESSPPEA